LESASRSQSNVRPDSSPVWLLLAILIVAFVPARSVYRYLTRTSVRRQIAQPFVDTNWPSSSSHLGRDLLSLAVLAALAVFIFTKFQAQIAKSQVLWPALMLIIGVWTLATVPRGLKAGRIEPMARGFYSTYAREKQPTRFWTSIGWNAAFGCFVIWLGIFGIEEAPTRALNDRCDDYNAAPGEQLAACSQLIGKGDKAGLALADLKEDRGSAYYRLGDYPRAVRDYDDALRMDPNDSSAHYNLGLIDEQIGDRPRAIAEYTGAIRTQPDNADAYLRRGVLFLDAGRFDQAVTDFTRVHELRPKDPWSLANRGISYAWLHASEKAERDFAAVRAIDPANPVLLRGEALLDINAGNLKAAIGNLTAALKIDPRDAWSLRMRAQVFKQLGNYENFRADEQQLNRMSTISTGKVAHG
jgi:Flp pilus assembly protein TadD